MHIPVFNATHLKLAIFLGLLGFALNLYPIPLFANVQLILGNTAVVITAKLLGPYYALLTALGTATGLALSWDNPHVYIVFLLEALWLGFARRKNARILYASICYWLLIGLPIMGLYLWFITGTETSLLLFMTIKQAFNSIFYTTLGELCVFAMPSLWHLKGKLVNNNSRHTFSAQLSYLFILITTISLLTSSLVFNHYFINNQQELINRNLNNTSIFLSHAIENYIGTSTRTIGNISDFIIASNIPLKQWQNVLTSVQNLTPNFINLFIANENGEITSASPIEKLNQIKQLNSDFNIKDRDYFVEAFIHNNTFVSPIMVEEGINKESITLSTPMLLPSHNNRPIGIVGGSLNLGHFSNIDKQNQHYDTQSMILLDEKKNIIYASERLELKPLTPFSYTTGNPKYKTKLNLMNISQGNTEVPEFIYTYYKLNNGWDLYIVEPFIPLLTITQKQYMKTIVLVFISMICAAIVAKTISRLMTMPLALLAQHFTQDKNGNTNQEKFEYELLGDSMPLEIYSLYESLEANQQALLNHQFELENKVKRRTIDLEIANRRLKNMAERDPLTNLYNRRYTENQFTHIQDLCERSQDSIAVVLLDLDFFKKVNDTYGHLAGDECLRAMAKELSSHFKRDVDLLCRYGGEEFILILPMCNTLRIEQHLNLFRENLANVVITSPVDQVTFSITVSIGAIIADATYSHSFEVWLKQADENLYKAKEQGRNSVVCTLIKS